MQAILRRLDHLRVTLDHLEQALRQVEAMPQMHELRLSTKLGDVQQELQTLVTLTRHLVEPEGPKESAT